MRLVLCAPQSDRMQLALRRPLPGRLRKQGLGLFHSITDCGCDSRLHRWNSLRMRVHGNDGATIESADFTGSDPITDNKHTELESDAVA